jgi:DNA-binding transcriptional MerR regulator
MQNDFYTSTEAGQVTGCSRRQLQYWRDKGVVVPTVNPSGKGRNVYYSVRELLALTVMNYLLSLGLSFEISVQVLAILRDRESWLFGESLEPSQSKRWAILLRLKGNSPTLVDFDRDVVLKTIEDGGGAIDLASDRIYKHLKERLAGFMNKIAKMEIEQL